MGGTWTSQNKIRPGVYLNFTAVAPPTMQIGDRGIATMALPMNWGAEDELIELYSVDMMNGDSLAKVGVTAFDEDAKLMNLMLSNCYLAKVFRMDSGGDKATASHEDFTVTARYAGTLGNEINVTVSDMSGGVYRVTTFVRGDSVDVQDVTATNELVDNMFVSFAGDESLVGDIELRLSGGTNGTVDAAEAYPKYLGLARKSRWQTMALTQDNSSYASQFANFIEQMRDSEGKYVQVVVSNYNGADSIGVINSDCGVRVGDTVVTSEEATAWVAGLTAGAAINQSIGSRAFPGATAILNERTDSEIAEALENGLFILSTTQRGSIVVEDDINSLHTFSNKYSKDMRLNQVIRVMDEIGTNATDIWEQYFKHKAQNDKAGRDTFKAMIISYFNDLQNMPGGGAIEEFAGAEDISVEIGAEKDAVKLSVNAKPVAAMSKLYGLIYIL